MASKLDDPACSLGELALPVRPPCDWGGPDKTARPTEGSGGANRSAICPRLRPSGAVDEFSRGPHLPRKPDLTGDFAESSCGVLHSVQGFREKFSIGLEPITPSLPSGPGWFRGSGAVRTCSVKSLQSEVLCGVFMTGVYRAGIGLNRRSGPTAYPETLRSAYW
jgi:hypothetical protein